MAFLKVNGQRVAGITEQEILESAIELWADENPGKEIPNFSINTHQEFGREYMEALPDGEQMPNAPRFFTDHYQLVTE